MTTNPIKESESKMKKQEVKNIFKQEEKIEKQISLRLSPELFEFLHRLSDQNGISVNKSLVRMVEYFQEKTGEKGR